LNWPVSFAPRKKFPANPFADRDGFDLAGKFCPIKKIYGKPRPPIRTRAVAVSVRHVPDSLRAIQWRAELYHRFHSAIFGAVLPGDISPKPLALLATPGARF
jgi:hypothetical protein